MNSSSSKKTNNVPSSAKKIDKYHYNLHDIIGQGSFATVYLGKDIENDELRAIKVINTSAIGKNQAIMSSIINEVKIVKSLNNSNVIKCYDVLNTSNNTYLIMDYCEGGDLKTYLNKYKRLSEEKALDILKQILHGYHELYKNGIIHRDLKTENILLKNEVFKIADFGFAKMLLNFEKDVLKSLVGTPLYMSPQILKQDDYTSKSDIWSIGIIFFEMIFGKTPWNSISNNDLLKKILSEPVTFPAGISISDLSKEFILKCLKIEEIDRISWTDIYSHELFNDCFNYRRKKSIYETKVSKLGEKLGSIAKLKNIDIYKLFQSIDNNKNEKLEIDEFSRLLLKIDDNLTREQMEFIFNKVDRDNSNYIDFEEFKQWLASTSTSMPNEMYNVPKIAESQKRFSESQSPLYPKNTKYHHSIHSTHINMTDLQNYQYGKINFENDGDGESKKEILRDYKLNLENGFNYKLGSKFI